jgi:chromosome segregation ATPase
MSLNDNRNDFERLNEKIKETSRVNRKLQLRVETFEKKLELEQMKEQRTLTMYKQVNEQLDKYRSEHDDYLTSVDNRRV